MTRKVTAEKRIAMERRRVMLTGHTTECAATGTMMPRLGDAPPCPCLSEMLAEVRESTPPA